jgi:hypothetical protein
MQTPIDGDVINRIARLKQTLDGWPDISPGAAMCVVSPEIDQIVAETKGMPRNDTNLFLSCLAVIVRLRDLLSFGLKNPPAS